MVNCREFLQHTVNNFDGEFHYGLGLKKLDGKLTWFVSYKRKYVHKLLVNRLLKPAQETVWLSELTVPQWP